MTLGDEFCNLIVNLGLVFYFCTPNEWFGFIVSYVSYKGENETLHISFYLSMPFENRIALKLT
jgi:hypothetical protein